jgi:uncharacterized protein
VHISEMSDRFVKDPLEAVKVGDVLEFRIIGLDTERRRISLSRKSGAASVGGKPTPKTGDGASGGRADDGKKRVVAVKAGHGADRRSGSAERAGAAPVGHSASVESHGAERRGGERASETRGGGWQGGDRGRLAKDDDGTMYNPFADALRKMKEKGGRR